MVAGVVADFRLNYLPSELMLFLKYYTTFRHRFCQRDLPFLLYFLGRSLVRISFLLRVLSCPLLLFLFYSHILFDLQKRWTFRQYQLFVLVRIPPRLGSRILSFWSFMPLTKFRAVRRIRESSLLEISVSDSCSVFPVIQIFHLPWFLLFPLFSGLS